MFVRKKVNKSGVVSVQIINKSSGKYSLVKTVGSSSDPDEIEYLFLEGLKTIPQLLGQHQINFNSEQDALFETMFENSIEQIELVGPDRVLGGIFEDVGFDKIPEPLFRDLVVSRLAYPGSKLRTVDYLHHVRGVYYDIDYVYRYLDTLHSTQKTLVEDISYQHTLGILGGEIRLVIL